MEWDRTNDDVGFEIVDSDGDLSIRWKRWMAGTILGQHSHTVPAGDGDPAMHQTAIRLLF